MEPGEARHRTGRELGRELGGKQTPSFYCHLRCRQWTPTLTDTVRYLLTAQPSCPVPPGAGVDSMQTYRSTPDQHPSRRVLTSPQPPGAARARLRRKCRPVTRWGECRIGFPARSQDVVPVVLVGEVNLGRGLEDVLEVHMHSC